MTITVDLATEAIRTGTGSPTTGSHAGAASGVKGVVIALMHGTSDTDHITAVSYGGVALTKQRRDTDPDTEAGAAELWFCGQGCPQGTQTWSYTSGATTDDIDCRVVTLLAATDLVIADTDGLSNTEGANPSLLMTSFGRNCMAFAAQYSGLTAETSLTAGASCTKVGSGELTGNFCSGMVRQTTSGTGNFTIAMTSAADDLAFSAILVSEVRTQTHTYSGVGTQAMTKSALAGRTFTYSGVGSSAFSKIATMVVTTTYSGVGTSALSKVIGKLFSYAATATSAVTKQVNLVREYAATGTSALTNALSFTKSFAYTAVGTLGLVRAAMFSIAAAFSAVGTSAFSKVFVPGAVGAGIFVSYARVWMFNEVRKVYLTTTAFKNTVLTELRGSALWARWAPGTLPFSGSSNMQVDVTAIPSVPPLNPGGRRML